MGLRRKSRILALQFLFKQEMNRETTEEAFGSFCQHFQCDDKIIAFAKALVMGAATHQEMIDDANQKNSLNWRLSRMSSVDRNILRLAVYELLFAKDTPASVVIDEAIEITREFGTDDSGSFINGILNAVIKNLAG